MSITEKIISLLIELRELFFEIIETLSALQSDKDKFEYEYEYKCGNFDLIFNIFDDSNIQEENEKIEGYNTFIPNINYTTT